MRYLFAFVFAALMSLSAVAQELQCSISVQSASVQGTNKQVYDNMRNALQDFMKAQIWTSDKFDTKERIECSLNFNITEQISSNEFKGTLTVQLRRPVYNSAYTTTTFNMQDNDIQFRYNEGQPLTFNPSSYDSDNLVPLIAFYVYFMLGIDYDTFSLNGGSPYFKQAEAIVNQAQSSSFAGWKSFDGTKNRYWLINNALDDNHKIFHRELYNYHRRGLDQMAESVDRGRQAIYNSIDQLKKVKQNSTRNAYLLTLFFTAKSDEIVNIFSGAPQMERDKALEALQVADPANISKYNKIKNSK
ncbi:MAG: DUF4835 family protein [Bacteroidales bacterium]|nr:DUF4835 family protein [Bacteroidales bacterium]